MKQFVICFGSEWHGDDAFGHHVFNLLLESPTPDNCELIFAGDSVRSIPVESMEASQVFLIDAFFDPDSQHGSLIWLDADELLSYQPAHLHDSAVVEWLKHLPILMDTERMPVIKILAVTINQLQGFNEHLSTPVKEQLGVAVRQVLDQLDSEQETAA